jgi:hypothetical protein
MLNESFRSLTVPTWNGDVRRGYDPWDGILNCSRISCVQTLCNNQITIKGVLRNQVQGFCTLRNSVMLINLNTIDFEWVTVIALACWLSILVSYWDVVEVMN